MVVFELEWICKENRLPEDWERILLFDVREGEVIGYYCQEGEKFILSADGSRLYAVTHWMPLPPQP